MDTGLPPDIESLERQLDDAERDARTILEGLDDAMGGWRPAPGSWSVAECLDHLATANRVYLEAMRAPAEEALAHGRLRRGPATPGMLGRLFVRSLEPTTTMKTRAPKKIRPRGSPPLADAAARFHESQDRVRAFLRAYKGIDLAGVTFPNPFLPGVRFSLATGLHVITAHERRHLQQARRVREGAEAAMPRETPASTDGRRPEPRV